MDQEKDQNKSLRPNTSKSTKEPEENSTEKQNVNQNNDKDDHQDEIQANQKTSRPDTSKSNKDHQPQNSNENADDQKLGGQNSIENDKNTENEDKKGNNQKSSRPSTAKSVKDLPENDTEEQESASQKTSDPNSRQNSAKTEINRDQNQSPKPQNIPEVNSHTSEPKSRQNSAKSGGPADEYKDNDSVKASRKNSAASTKLPYIDKQKKNKAKEDSRMYSPDDDLTIDDFMKNLQEDNIQLTKELDEWRKMYDVQIEKQETENILAGKPSLKGLGLNDEEEKIAEVVVKSKMSEMGKMSTQELVDFVRLSSY